MLSLDSVVVQNPRTASRNIGGEGVVMTPDDSMLHSLNETGTRIWECLEEQRSLSDIVSVICDEFAVDRANAEKDVIEFCSTVLEKGMITVVE